MFLDPLPPEKAQKCLKNRVVCAVDLLYSHPLLLNSGLMPEDDWIVTRAFPAIFVSPSFPCVDVGDPVHGVARPFCALPLMICLLLLTKCELSTIGFQQKVLEVNQ